MYARVYLCVRVEKGGWGEEHHGKCKIREMKHVLFDGVEVGEQFVA